MHKGVESYVILDGSGEVLRSYPPNNEDAEEYGTRLASDREGHAYST